MRMLVKVGIAAGISVALGILVFVTAALYTNPSYAFYAGLSVGVCGLLITPIVLMQGK
jgi:hypothetical protein